MCFHGSRMATPSVDVVGYSALNFADAACTHSKKIKGVALLEQWLRGGL
jgi:hypothetical protein